jgi:serine/threonine protein kinase/tetratricopeptide (TPR) repeat protein
MVSPARGGRPLASESMIGRSFGPYRVIAPLGEGGMATVWIAVERGLERNVALKVLKTSLTGDRTVRRRFLAEARNASMLNHPSIATVLGADIEGSDLYIAYQLVEGQTVSDIARRAPLSIAEVVRIGLDVGSALSVAHAHGVVHRDITGRNVMLDRYGRAVVLDFGLSQAEWASSLTTRDVRVGTPGYMAPELAGEQRADARSDLFSLGVVMFEALTGRRPFEGPRVEIIAFAIVSLPPPSPRALRPDTPEALEAIILRLLEKGPADRYQSADELVADLRTLGERPATDDVAIDAVQRTWELAAPTSRFLAIPPFHAPTSGDGDDSALVDLSRSLTDAVASALARDGDVRVVPPDQIRQIPATDDLRTLARRVGANAVLRGELRASGPRLRATLALVDPFGGVQIDGAVVEGTRSQRFEFEDAIVSAARQMARVAAGQVGAPGGELPVPDDRLRQALSYLQREENEAMVDGAIDILERLEQTCVPDHRVLSALARAYLAKFRLTWTASWESKAAVACESAADLAPQSTEVKTARGYLCLSAGRNEEARDAFGSAVEGPGDTYVARIGLALAHQALDRFAAAEESLQDAIKEKPDGWLAHKHLGLLYYRQGRFADALIPWRRAAELTPDNAQIHANLASAHFFLDHFDEALEGYRRSIQLQPRAVAYTNLGSTLFYLGRHEEAADAFARATSLNPTDPRAWGNLGSAFMKVAGHDTEAREALRHAVDLLRGHLERNPTDAQAWGRLASWQSNLGERKRAFEAMDRALELVPDDVEIMAWAGTLHYQEGDRQGAMGWFRSALHHGYSPTRLLRDPFLKGLEEDEAFRKIMEDVSRQKRR